MKTLGIIGFLLISVLCIYFRIGHIENDLMVRSAEATQKANLPLPGLEFDGRDAILSGMIDSEAIKDKIEQIVAGVYGVRLVHNNLIVTEKQKQPVKKDTASDKIQKTLNTLVFNQKVEFANASSVLTRSGKLVLSEIADLIKEHSLRALDIIGHTDNTGEVDRNLILSQKRAESVKRYLVGLGVDASALRTEGRGSSKPVADNTTAIGRNKNRRVEFIIVKGN